MVRTVYLTAYFSLDRTYCVISYKSKLPNGPTISCKFGNTMFLGLIIGSSESKIEAETYIDKLPIPENAAVDFHMPTVTKGIIVTYSPMKGKSGIRRKKNGNMDKCDKKKSKQSNRKVLASTESDQEHPRKNAPLVLSLEISDNEETIPYQAPFPVEYPDTIEFTLLQDATCTNILEEAIRVNHLSSELDLDIEGNLITFKES